MARYAAPTQTPYVRRVDDAGLDEGELVAQQTRQVRGLQQVRGEELRKDGVGIERAEEGGLTGVNDECALAGERDERRSAGLEWMSDVRFNMV